MDGEPTNAAAEHCRYGVRMGNNEEWARTNGLTLVTPDFVRYDRRRITGQPPVDRHAWHAGLVSLAEVSGGWPEFSIPAVLAVRGERLVLYRLLITFRNGSELQYVVLSQSNESLQRTEVVIFFDPEDVELALAELDRRHEELEGEIVPSS